MWKCPSLCDEQLIQEPVNTTKKMGVYYCGPLVVVSCCPLCGKEMSYHIMCKNTRKAGFIISPTEPPKGE